MKEIKAYIRRERVNQVVKTLEGLGASGIMIVESHPVGYGYEPNYFDSKSMEFERYGYLAIVKLEVVCAYEQVKALVQTVQEWCRTGDKGDGMIFVSGVSDAIRIRDGVRGKEAL